MKVLKEYNKQISKEREDWKKRQVAKYGDTRLRAGVLCDNCHDKGKKVEMVITNKMYSNNPPILGLECQECGHEGGLDFHAPGEHD